MIGDVLEFAYWMTGEETEGELTDFSHAAEMAMTSYMEEENCLLSKGVAHTKRPGDERCPEVPDHIHGTDVQLLVIEAQVLMDLPKESRFADELEKDDFNRLAKITRSHYARRFPKHPPLTDGQVRTVINDLGPDAALDALRGYVADTTEYIQ